MKTVSAVFRRMSAPNALANLHVREASAGTAHSPTEKSAIDRPLRRTYGWRRPRRRLSVWSERYPTAGIVIASQSAEAAIAAPAAAAGIRRIAVA